MRRGRREKTSHLDVFFLSSAEGSSRVGFVVPKYRRRAVDRNRLKRRLREIVRKDVLPSFEECGLKVDFLLRSRQEAFQARYHELRQELLEVTERLCSGRSSWR
jgi:ribonuclease P protein component